MVNQTRKSKIEALQGANLVNVEATEIPLEGKKVLRVTFRFDNGKGFETTIAEEQHCDLYDHFRLVSPAEL